MRTIIPYEDEAEKKRHNNVIQRLAQDLGVDEAEIRRVYELKLGELKEHARIKDYLTVFVSRKVRESFKQQATGDSLRQLL